jgi:hypothetical protein
MQHSAKPRIPVVYEKKEKIGSCQIEPAVALGSGLAGLDSQHARLYLCRAKTVSGYGLIGWSDPFRHL